MFVTQRKQLGIVRNTLGGLLPNKKQCIQWINSKPFFNTKNGYWEFKDKLGSSNRTIQEGKCYDFDGTDDYVEFKGYKPYIGASYYDFEITVTRTDGKTNGFYNDFDSLPDRFGWLWYTDNRMRFYVSDGSGTYKAGFTGVLDGYSGEAVTVRVIYDGHLSGVDRVKFYVNGSQVTTTSCNVPSIYAGSGTENMCLNKTPSSYGFGKAGNIIIRDSNGNILHSWHCDEGAGSIAYDSVGSQNGTIINADLTTFHSTDNHFTSYQNQYGYNAYRFFDNDYLYNTDFDEAYFYDRTAGTDKVKFEFKGVVFRDTSTNPLFSFDENDSMFGLSSNKLYFKMYNTNSTFKILITDYTPETNKAYDISVEFGESGAEIFVDGVSVGSSSENFRPRHINGRQAQIGIWQKQSTSSVYAYLHGFIQKANLYYNNTLINSWDLNVDLTDSVGEFDLTDSNLTEIHNIPVKLNSDGSQTSEDVLENTTIKYGGRVKRNVKIVNSNVANFDGTDDYIVFSANNLFKPSSQFSFGLWFKSNENSSQSHDVFFRIRIDDNNRFYMSNPGIGYVTINGTGKLIPALNIYDQQWHHYVFVANGTTYRHYIDGELFREDTGMIDLGNMVGTPFLYIGGIGSSSYSFNGKISCIKVWNGKALTDEEVFKDYQGSSVSGLTLKIPLSVGDGTKVYELINNLEGICYNVDIATFWTTDDKAVPSNLLNGFNNYIYTYSGGISYTPSSSAYGTWEFEVKGDRYKHVWFIANNTNGYPDDNGYFVYIVSGKIYFYRADDGSGSTLFTTDVILDSNTVYRYKVVRDSGTGQFSVYIKGGSFGDEYTLIPVISGHNPVVDNTHTTSTYFKLHAYSSKAIANIVVNGVSLNPEDFSVSTGGHYFLRYPLGYYDDDYYFKAGSYHNNAESKIEQYKCPALWSADNGINYWYVSDSDDTPNELSFSDADYDVFDDGTQHHIIFSNAESNKWRDIITYNEAQSGDNLDKIYKFIKKP